MMVSLDHLTGVAGPGPARELLLKLNPEAGQRRPLGIDAVRRVTVSVLADEPGASAQADVVGLCEPAFDQRAVKAVIAAARADQRLGRTELDALAAGLEGVALDAAARNLLRAELSDQPKLDPLTRGLSTRAEMVAVYAASLLGTDGRDELSRHYLRMLAARLGLEKALTDRIEDEMVRQA